MEQLVTEIDPELAEYVSELDGKYPRQQEAAVTAGHEAAPLDLVRSAASAASAAGKVRGLCSCCRHDNLPAGVQASAVGRSGRRRLGAHDPGAAAGDPPAGGTTPPALPWRHYARLRRVQDPCFTVGLRRVLGPGQDSHLRADQSCVPQLKLLC